MNRFMIESLRNELMNRGLTIHKTAKLTGIRYELLRRSFNDSRELRARELITILEKTGIPIEKLIYKAPDDIGIKTLEWNLGEEMSKEYALTMLDGTRCFFRMLWFQPQIKPFNGEADFVGRMHELYGLKEFIEKRCGREEE